jgi:hypothetical protein
MSFDREQYNALFAEVSAKTSVSGYETILEVRLSVFSRLLYHFWAPPTVPATSDTLGSGFTECCGFLTP